MSKAKSSGGKKGDEYKSADVLQAVLLADSFAVKLRPITKEKPKVLLPLVNIPMLDYSLESLSAAGVREILVVCCAHATQIEQYLQGSVWTKKAPKLVVKAITIKDAYSAGDALRRVYNMQLIRSDPFVLISGDVISNISLATVIEQHRAARAIDKNYIMTVVFKRAAAGHRTRSLEDDTVIAMNPSTKQLLLYENNTNSASVVLDLELMAKSPELELHYDLMDCHIDICSPEVLGLFNTHFDFSDIRKDFIRGVLQEEIFEDKIRMHIISEGYAARVKDFRTYDSVSKDIIHRWTHPIVPDNNFNNTTSYKFYRHNVSKEDHVVTARSSRIGPNVVVGANTSISEFAVVKDSVIGRDCKIGANTVIINSYLWGSNVIADNVILDHVIVCDGVVVEAGANVQKGSILSFNVKIGANFTVPPYSKLTTFDDDDSEFFKSKKSKGANDGDDENEDDDSGFSSDEDNDDDDTFSSDEDSSKSASTSSSIIPTVRAAKSIVTNTSEVGNGGVGHAYADESDVESDEDEDDDEPSSSSEPAVARPPSFKLNSIAPDLTALKAYRSYLARKDEADSDFDDDYEEYSAPPQADEEKFLSEMAATLARGEQENLSVDDVFLEVQSLKFAHNSTLLDLSTAALLALYEIIQPPVVAGAVLTKAQISHNVKLIKRWHSIFTRFARDDSDRSIILNSLERASLANERQYGALFRYTLQLLYDPIEALNDDVILDWVDKREERNSADDQYLLGLAKDFISFVRENAEEEEEEEEEEDDEEFEDDDGDD